jgi:hypothetical protein
MAQSQCVLDVVDVEPVVQTEPWIEPVTAGLVVVTPLVPVTPVAPVVRDGQPNDRSRRSVPSAVLRAAVDVMPMMWPSFAAMRLVRSLRTRRNGLGPSSGRPVGER